MRSRLKVIAAVLATWLASASVELAQAQSTADGTKEDSITTLNPYILNEKMVNGWNAQSTFSGNRTAQELLDTPVAVSVVTSDFMQDIGATDTLGILKYAASGITNRTTYRDDYTVRGFRQGKSIDGLKANGGISLIGFSPLFDVERVEVVQGPTALVFSDYGNVGGTLNYVTKRPTATPQGDLMITVGNQNYHSVGVTQRGPLTADKSVRYRVTVGYSDDDGFVAKGTPVNDYSRSQLISESVDWTLSPRLEVRTDAAYTYMRQRGTKQAMIDPQTGNIWSGSLAGISDDTVWSRIKNTEERFRAEAIYRVTDDLTIRALYNMYAGSLDIDNPWSAGPGLDITEAPNYKRIINIYQQYYIFDGTAETSLIDASWKTDLTKGLQNRLNAGFLYESDDSSNLQGYPTLADFIIAAPPASRPGPQPLPAGSTPEDSRNGGWTSYVQDTLTALDGKLIVAAGGRYVSPSRTKHGNSRTVPNYGAVYKVTPTVSLYATYAESFVPQFGKDDFGTPLVDIIGKSTEGGLKVNALDGRLFGIVSYFDIKNDPVSRNVVINGVRGKKQFGKETNSGIEVEGGWVQPVADGNWSTYITTYAADPKTVDGDQPNGSVKEKYTLFTKYDFTSGPLKGFYFGGGFSHFGGAPGTGFAYSPGYTLYSALVGYGTQKWRLACNVDNVTDKRDAIVGSEGETFVYLAQPRNFKVTLTRRW